ncbi:META domain-containing protein [Hymenobacter properus]|uniref:META domain-containing protein n=1 Tax=Hymenobacter properus TaxID=2791026 RepID=A0A931BAR2_9BACT|nr:META domain-containing protein [Hymenobacter properus]MBF9140420.1 META domain-containing protein [Hymenobacter properus]MBR7719227.1 META domain-containing protein [Microvirga sp. SRT04]
MRLFLLFLAAAAVGCQTHPPQEKTATTPPIRQAPAAALRETHWVPRELAGQPVRLPADTREPYLTLRTDGTAEGNGSCNRFRGSFFSEKADELTFSPLMSTRMSCAAIETENAFTRALAQSRTYRISGDTLRLYDAANVPVARLEAVYLH